MNTEPASWMQDYENCKCPDFEARCFSDRVFRMMQKHTQPVRELTDEEIKQIFLEQTGFYFDDNPADDLALMDFARAILRKAQEK
jgi:predicted HTH transcriptional regulator